MKKNILIIILIIIIAVLSFKLITNNQYDVNKDGKVNSGDLLDLRLYLINKGDDN